MLNQDEKSNSQVLRTMGTRIGQLVGRTELWLFFAILLSYVFFMPRWAMWGPNTKLDLVMAIVRDGTFSIENYYTNTGDYALYEGVHYSDKAPGTSFLGVPFYSVYRLISNTSIVEQVTSHLEGSVSMTATLKEDGTGLLADKVDFALAMTFVTFFVSSLPSALLGVILYRFLKRMSPNSRANVIIVLAYSLCTIAFPASQLLDRQVVAVLTFSAFYLLSLGKRREYGTAWFMMVGFMLGWSMITDYPTTLIVAGLGIYTLFPFPRVKFLLALIFGGLLPIMLAMYFNYSCFNTPLPVGYFYSELYTDLHSIGFLSLTYPKLDALWGLTFSPFRGLFYRSPFLLFVIPGFVLMFRDRTLRKEWWVCLWSVTSFFLFNASSAMWWGGHRPGPTYITPMIPFMIPPIAYLFDRVNRLAVLRWLGVFSLVWSFIFVWLETISGQLFPGITPNPIWTVSLPKFLDGDIARNWGMLLGLNSHWSLIPLGVGLFLLSLPIFWGRHLSLRGGTLGP